MNQVVNGSTKTGNGCRQMISRLEGSGGQTTKAVLRLRGPIKRELEAHPKQSGREEEGNREDDSGEDEVTREKRGTQNHRQQKEHTEAKRSSQ